MFALIKETQWHDTAPDVHIGVLHLYPLTYPILRAWKIRRGIAYREERGKKSIGQRDDGDRYEIFRQRANDYARNIHTYMHTYMCAYQFSRPRADAITVKSETVWQRADAIAALRVAESSTRWIWMTILSCIARAVAICGTLSCHTACGITGASNDNPLNERTDGRSD